MKIKFNSPPSSPNEVSGLKVNYAPPKRPISKWRFRVVLILFLLPFLVFGVYLIYKITYNLLFINAPGYLIINQITIKAPYDGKVVYIKKQGDKIYKNEIIAKIENTLIENQYKELLKNLKQIQLTDSYKNNTKLVEIAKKMYENRLKTYQKIVDLKQQGAATTDEVTNALSQLNSAEISYLQAKSSLESSKNISIPIADNMRLNELESILKTLTIRSPENATIALNLVKEGEVVSKNEDLMVLQNNNDLIIEAFLGPNKIKHVFLGKKTKVIFPNGKSIQAEVIGLKLQTQKTPPILVSPFTKEDLSVVVELKPISVIPKNLMINYMPVKVIF
ncbi:HlyD family secretion protein [Desulfurella sp.]|uniref:HlyD family secretion protein n=1 Tax=Desulfurella sp. TaxID=1962857 RepID=UPI003D0983EB